MSRLALAGWQEHRQCSIKDTEIKARVPALWHFLHHHQVPDAEIMLKQLLFGETLPDLTASSPISCGFILLLSAPCISLSFTWWSFASDNKANKTTKVWPWNTFKAHTNWKVEWGYKHSPPPPPPNRSISHQLHVKYHVFHRYHPIWISFFLLFKPSCFCIPLFLAFPGLWRSVMTKVPS